MSEEILINVTPQETRVCVVENGILQEVHIERTQKRGLVGNIFKGRVSRVLPGMQAAFIDIGLERTGFLHSSDIVSNNIDPDSESKTELDSSLEELSSTDKTLFANGAILICLSLGQIVASITPQSSLSHSWFVSLASSFSL